MYSKSHYDSLHDEKQVTDLKGEPSMVKCQSLSYVGSVYFIITTVASVGFGDIAPHTIFSKAVICILIVASMIIIPLQVDELLFLMSAHSSYREPYIPQNGGNHCIICGHVNDKQKLEAFFKEFFHPDRMFSSGPEYHVVVLCPMEPDEAVRSLIISPMLDARVTYVIGSALNSEDLKKAGADTASGMFFLGNTNPKNDVVEDTTTVLRTLSASNYNTDLELLVQVLHPDDRMILKDSDVQVILCLDEYKTTLMARNSICPGFSTFIENIFHSFGGVSEENLGTMAPWYREYLHGAMMELYYVPLDQDFLRAIDYSFDKLCEAIFVEWSIVVLGLCNAEQDVVTFNPSKKDLGKHKSFKSFFAEFNVALIIADDNMQAEDIAKSLLDPVKVGTLLEKIEQEEDKYSVRNSRRKVENSRGLRRNQVIAPQLRPGGPELGRVGMSFLQKLQTKSFKGRAVRHAISVDDFDSDNSEPEDNYIGYAKERKEGKIVLKSSASDTREFDRATVVYTKSHDSARSDKTGKESSGGHGKGASEFPVINIEIESPGTVERSSRQRRSVMMKMLPTPLVNIVDNEKHGRGGSRTARKSMAIPIIKKRTIIGVPSGPSIKEEDSDDDDDDSGDDNNNDGNDTDNDADNGGSSKHSKKSNSRFQNSLSATEEGQDEDNSHEKSTRLISSTLNTWGSVLQEGKRKMSGRRYNASTKPGTIVPTASKAITTATTPPPIEIPDSAAEKAQPCTNSSPINTASPTPPKSSWSPDKQPVPHVCSGSGVALLGTASAGNNPDDDKLADRKSVGVGPTLGNAKGPGLEMRTLTIKPTARRLPPLGMGVQSQSPSATTSTSPFTKPKILPRKIKINIEGPSQSLITPESIAAAKANKKKIPRIKIDKSTTTKGSMYDVLKELKARVPVTHECSDESPETRTARKSSPGLVPALVRGEGSDSGRGSDSSGKILSTADKESGDEGLTAKVLQKPPLIRVVGPTLSDASRKAPGPGQALVVALPGQSSSGGSANSEKGDEEECKSMPEKKPGVTSPTGKRFSLNDLETKAKTTKALLGFSARAFGALMGFKHSGKGKKKSAKENGNQDEEVKPKKQEEEESKKEEQDVMVKCEIDGHVILNDELTPGNYGEFANYLHTYCFHIVFIYMNC
jgi:hypothetical protein